MVDTLRLRTRTADRLPYTAVDALLLMRLSCSYACLILLRTDIEYSYVPGTAAARVVYRVYVYCVLVHDTSRSGATLQGE